MSTKSVTLTDRSLALHKAAKPAMSSKKDKHHHVSDDFWLWLASQCVDYLFCLAMLFSQTMYGLPVVPFDSLRFAGILVLAGHVAILLLYLREEVHFVLLGNRVASEKVQGSLSRQTWFLVWKTATFSQISMFFLGRQGLFPCPPVEWTWQFWALAYLEFYAMLVLRDVFSLWPFHGLMHTHKRWYVWHKTHHQIRRDAQGMHSFHIDLVDLVLENLGAFGLLLLAQYLLGLSPGIHWFASALLTCHDGALHSINPYSSMYFNPVLDHVLKGNVHHQLHHALNSAGHLLFVPYHHAWSRQERRKDLDKYNAIFETDFVLA